MPRQYEMSWAAKRAGWTKWFRLPTWEKPRSFAVSCRQLGTEPTKEASWRAANEWWREKEAELRRDEASRAVPSPLDPSSASIQSVLEAMDVRELRNLAERGRDAERLLEILGRASIEGAEAEGDRTPMPVPHATASRLAAGEGIPSSIIDGVLSGGFTTELPADFRDRELGRIGEAIRPVEVPPDRTIEAQVAAWVRNKYGQHVAGRISAGRYDAYRRNIATFEAWAGPKSDVSVLTAQKLRDYYGWLCREIGAGRFSAAYCRSLLNAAKNFLTTVAELGLIPLPGNIRSREFAFDDSTEEIPSFTKSEVRSLLDGCDGYSERIKLYLLLMLNCGMYQNDIAELRHGEVDLERGTIARKRSKRKKGGLKVTYKLWPETLELLRRHCTEGVGNDLVLLSEDGNPLVSYRASDGDLDRYDLIAQAYRNLRKRVGVKLPLKVFRKTSANTIEKHKEYGRFYHFFLAHSPKTLGEKHYVTPSEEIFFETLEWLRGELLGETPQ
ncbi:MAG: hypothetical protein BGO49_20810 [Planctomycetales bacterium 71-10]|nr:MAG: hypothetical protein BGO49_20810 [Planctomycetales bacterium 71-10]